MGGHHREAPPPPPPAPVERVPKAEVYKPTMITDKVEYNAQAGVNQKRKASQAL